MRWTTVETDETAAAAISEALDLPLVLGRLLSQRGVDSPEGAEAFLRPRLSMLESPFEMSQLEAAVDRIEKAVEAKEDVVVFGDYDVDGITSTVQLVGLLRVLELEPRFCVPRRLEEGYGLSREALDRVFDNRIPNLVVALDCGTNAHEPLVYLRDLGVDVVVVDHHKAKDGVPKDCILVNPHVNDAEDSPWRDLCTAGLVFKLLHGILKKRREAEDPRVSGVLLKDYLDLVAMGTIADLVPLHGENRILSWYGLQHLRASNRHGVRALAEVCGIGAGHELVGSDISFKMGPRINASGRIADATLPVEMLLSSDYARCRKIASELDEMNRERQSIERRIAKEAEARAETEFAEAPGIVLFGEDWHPGVVGIVASRVSRRFHKPCVILGAEGDMAKGSGRSVADINLVSAFQACADLLDHWGGHPMAAGVSLDAEHVPEFAERFVKALNAMNPDGLPEPSLEVSAWIPETELGLSLLEQVDRLQPFGQGNPEPVFGLRAVCLESGPEPFGEGHFRFAVACGEDGSERFPGVAWKQDNLPPADTPLDLALRIGWNHWRGMRTPQITLVDWTLADPVC